MFRRPIAYFKPPFSLAYLFPGKIWPAAAILIIIPVSSAYLLWMFFVIFRNKNLFIPSYSFDIFSYNGSIQV